MADHTRFRTTPRRHRRAVACIASLLILGGAAPAPTVDAVGRALTMDDLLDRQTLDRATTSPDGEWVAAVIRRGARPGEAYGRTSYEVDATRSDVWLLSTRTGERRRLTDGAARAAGFWCATWSPDGRRLAMLSTTPEGDEPRGGDNVRLYVWERDTGALRRLGNWPVITQSRYGSPLDQLDLRGGARGAGDGADAAHACSVGLLPENAPFLWLDSQRLLIATLAAGEVSAAVGHYTRPYRIATADAARLRDGMEPTGSAVASGAARTSGAAVNARVTFRVADTATGAAFAVAAVPAYPFRGALTASVSPDGRRLAVLATVGALPPVEGRIFPHPRFEEWSLERRLGFADLVPGKAVRWVTMPAAARLPLELYGWSPDARAVAFRARDDAYATETPLFTARADTGGVTAAGRRSVGGEATGIVRPLPAAALWLDRRRLAARGPDGTWTVVEGQHEVPATVPTGVAAPDRLLRAADGALAALSGQTLLRLDPKQGFVKVADLGGGAFVPPADDGTVSPGRPLVVLNRPGAPQSLATLDLVTGALGIPFPVPAGQPLATDPAHPSLLYLANEGSGQYLRRGSAAGTRTELLALNTYLDAVNWGQRRLIAYEAADGTKLNGSLILPPNYRPGQRLPLLVWVYGGYQVPADLNGDYMTGRDMPGIYNLYLYAARGYAVLVPSMPLGPRDGKRDVYTELPKGVLPAVDKVAALGIIDPARVGVFGQSYGGYSVMGLLGETRRFRAGVAIAGISELVSNWGQFDPTARGYPGIEHEKSANVGMTELFGLHAPPWVDPDGYRRNSPLSFVNKVQTPLLMLHGEFDTRGAPTQAELFFQGLYSRGRTAELVRYGGESHSLHQSPANVRDVFERTVAWFDRFLQPVNGDAGSVSGP